MKITIIYCSTLAAVILFVSASGEPCGGILEGDNGNFQYAPLTVNGKEAQNCVWLVHAYGASKLSLKFNEIVTSGSHPLILHPQRSPGGASSDPIRVSTTAVGSTFDLPGSTVLIILPQANSTISFTWDSETTKCSAPIDSVPVMTDFIETPLGNLTWSPRKRQERLWWIIGSGQSADDFFEWRTKADLSGCDKSRPCSCFSFEAYGINNEGSLVEIEKVCGASSSGSFEVQSYPLVIAASAYSTTQGRSGLELQWKPIARPAPVATYIYFGTAGGGIKSYSLETSTVSTVVDSTEDLEAIAYDSTMNKIYFCRWDPGQIYRANVDGSEIETLSSNVDFVKLFDIASDQRTGNLYVVNYINSGGIFVCNTTSASLNCVALPTGGYFFIGIALDSDRGEMFMAGFYGIYRAQMDGSGFTTLVPGASGVTATGITLDPDSGRLFWTYDRTGQIVSSFRNGSGIETVVQVDLPVWENSSGPWGLVVLDGILYWGNWEDGTLQRISVTGEGLATIYSGTRRVQQLTLIPSPDPKRVGAKSVSSPCESQGCSHMCVTAAANTYRCFCPQGLHLAGDSKTCLDANVKRI